MKKQISRGLALLMVLAMMLSMVSITAFASGDGTEIYNYVNKSTLTAGTWTTLKPVTYTKSTDTYNVPCYKITVPSDGKLVIYAARVSGDTGYGLTLRNSSKNTIVSGLYNSTSNSGTYRLAVSAGTYYICSELFSDYTTKVKYSFTKASDSANYSIGRAAALKKNTTVGICATFKNSYTRWYKVTLTSTQYLHVAATSYNGDYSCANTATMIYDKYGQYVNTTVKSYGVCSSKKLSKGTYYIQVFDFGYNDRYSGAYTTVKWY